MSRLRLGAGDRPAADKATPWQSIVKRSVLYAR
jgi:hypothetical protein